MACHTCDHSMQRISETERVFWCPRCGSIKRVPTGAHTEVCVPMLVERCRQFQASNGDGLRWKQLWHRVGINESIQPPGRIDPS